MNGCSPRMGLPWLQVTHVSGINRDKYSHGNLMLTNDHVENHVARECHLGGNGFNYDIHSTCFAWQ